MRNRLRLAKIVPMLLAGSLLAGCSWIVQALRADENQRNKQEQQQRREHQAKLERELAAARDNQVMAELEQLRGELLVQRDAGAVEPAKALAYAEVVEVARRSGTMKRRQLDVQVHYNEANESLLAAAEDHPEDRYQLLVVHARLLARSGAIDPAAQVYVELLTQEPQLAVFDELRSLPATSATDTATARGCGLVRSQVGEDVLFEFLDTCISRIRGGRDVLNWPQLAQDLERYDAETKRRARVAAREAAEREREAAAQAKRDAEAAKTAAMQQNYAYAAVFAAGRCEFGDCIHRGWNTRTPDGEVRVRCEFSECLTRGWEARFPDGTTARTRCEFSECMTRGWETRFADGTTARTRCEFGDCKTRGWETRLPDGTTARTR
ncbi:MAG: hypothetical protein ACPG4T_16705, partial [Nannocystaceae bacterium]